MMAVRSASGFSSVGSGQYLEGRAYSSPSSTSFRSRNAGLRGAPRASLHADVFGAARSRFARTDREVGFAKLDPVAEQRKRVDLGALPSDVAVIGDSVQSEERSEEALIDKLLSLVEGGDRGADLNKEEQNNIAEIVGQLEEFGMPEPLKSPLVFGDWDVAYSSNPTSPGGYYRSWLGRLVFKTKDMVQTITAPDFVINIVRFALFGFIAGQVILQGKLKALDNKLIQVDFEPPSLQLGPFKFQYGKNSTVKISLIYLNERLRLGRGSRGTVFVFTRR